MSVAVKVCGLRTAAAVDAAVAGGAAMVGFVFFPPSPRALDPDAAAALATRVPARVTRVGVVVDPEDTALDHLLERVPLDLLQLHGTEGPSRITAIRRRTGLPVMKAVRIAHEADLAAVAAFAAVADRLLFDAKPPAGATVPGGHGLTFDWRLLQGLRCPVPWLLSGGLTADNLAEAVVRTGAAAVDVSSGVEVSPGVKDVCRITAFLETAAGLASARASEVSA